MGSRRVDVGPVDAFADGEVRRVEVEGRGLAIVRQGNAWYALRDICPHQGRACRTAELGARRWRVIQGTRLSWDARARF